jgi:2-iminoacetate synthase ThiH
MQSTDLAIEAEKRDFESIWLPEQTSWVKLGAAGVDLCLTSGANDLGGTLMNERNHERIATFQDARC